MTISTDEIRTTVDTYLARYPDEHGRMARLWAALDNGYAPTSRKEFRGHVTCGAGLIDTSGRVLHIRHNVLGFWLLPGGHIDPIDESLPDAALRELREETGIGSGLPTAVSGFETIPLDIDVHPIPANPDKGEPDHWHFDFRYIFHAAGSPPVRLQDEEVNSFGWLTPDAVPAVALRAKLLALNGTA